MRLVLAAIFVLATLATAHASPLWTLNVIPAGGSLSGSPGDTVGWGYEITNDDPSLWLALSGIFADTFQYGTPDSSIFDYPVVGPSSAITVPFAASLQGLFQFTWDLSAPIGAVNVGLFTVSADLYDGDPFAGGSFVSTAPDAAAAYSVTVVSATATPVPEPGTLPMLFLGISIAAGARWLTRRPRLRRERSRARS